MKLTFLKQNVVPVGLSIRNQVAVVLWHRLGLQILTLFVSGASLLPPTPVSTASFRLRSLIHMATESLGVWLDCPACS